VSANEYSRPAAAARSLGALAPDAHRFHDKRVLLTGESVVLGTANGRECLLAGLRLLIRFCRDVTVRVPASTKDVADECHAVLDDLDIVDRCTIATGDGSEKGYDAILSIGTRVRSDLPWTVINSNGWLARVSSGRTELASDCDLVNPIGALGAASLGATEVFKRLINLQPQRGKLLDGTTFSLFTYQAGSSDPGPALPPELRLNAVLTGAGAIGNGVVYLLLRLPISGQLIVIDRQDYAEENWGTSLLVSRRHFGVAKAAVMERMLAGRLDVRGFKEDLDVLATRLELQRWFPRVAIGCLDNIDARHRLQQLWPDLVLDGAIGDFACQVSRHPWNEDTACVQCLFRHPPGEAAETVATRLTGLGGERVSSMDSPVTEDDVRAAPTERRDWLRARVGKSVCSVVQEAVAQQISADALRPGFAPSVLFVACLSSSMVVAELVKDASGYHSVLEPRFQMDALRGPVHGCYLPQGRSPDCVCVLRRKNIIRAREQRRAHAR